MLYEVITTGGDKPLAEGLQRNTKDIILGERRLGKKPVTNFCRFAYPGASYNFV